MTWTETEAQKFLELAREAMEPDNAHALAEMVQNRDSDLVRYEASWRECAEGTEVSNFESVVHFLNRALIGVDCDGDPALRMGFADRRDDLREMPFFHVPKPDNGDIDGHLTAISKAQANADQASRIVQRLLQDLSWELDPNDGIKRHRFEGLIKALAARENSTKVDS